MKAVFTLQKYHLSMAGMNNKYPQNHISGSHTGEHEDIHLLSCSAM
jgi:hypothetical protein